MINALFLDDFGGFCFCVGVCHLLIVIDAFVLSGFFLSVLGLRF